MKLTNQHVHRYLFAVLALLLLTFGMNSCGNLKGDDQETARLINMKLEVDSLIKSKVYFSEVLVKLTGKNGLEVVKYDNWPVGIDKVYTVWRSQDNTIRLINYTPLHHEKGLNLVYEHYFDLNGKTFAFVQTTEFFNTVCSGYPLQEKRVLFFNEDFERLLSYTAVVDDAGNMLDSVRCKRNEPPISEVSPSGDLQSYLDIINQGQ